MTRGTDFNVYPPTGGLRNYRKGYEDGLNRGKAELAEVLDKISAEIKDLHNSHMINFVSADSAVDTCLEIIEKYKKEGTS